MNTFSVYFHHTVTFAEKSDLAQKYISDGFSVHPSPVDQNKLVITTEAGVDKVMEHAQNTLGAGFIAAVNHAANAGRLKSHRIFTARTATALLPSAVAKAYNFPVGVDVSQRKVAIVELGGDFNPNDVTVYCNRYGFKQPKLSTATVDGTPVQPDPQGADGEVCLDIDAIAAVAQGVQIVVIFAPNTNTGFVDGIIAATKLQPDAISISWGAPEDVWDAQSRAAMDAAIKSAAEAGINVYVAAGDNGSSDGEHDNNVDYPGVSPYAISCGGTHLELNADGTRQLETAWSLSSDGSGGGGGFSAVYPVPAFQAGNFASSLPLSNRAVPDISGNADPSTGYLIDIDGTVQQIGGTSAVAPLYAAYNAIYNALTNSRRSLINTTFYTRQDAFFDVVSGSNGAYKAGPGYDLVTGLGVLDGTKFLSNTSIPPVQPPAPPAPPAPKKTWWQKLLSLIGL